MNRERVAELLPEAFRVGDREGSPTRALLELMAAMLDRSEGELDRVDENFDARSSRDRFVSYLAAWVDVDRVQYGTDGSVLARRHGPPTLPSGIGRWRELVAAGHELARWRGTRHGLLRYLEVATGVRGFQIDEAATDEQGQTRSFFLRIMVPAAARRYAGLVTRIVELEKPVYVQCELEFIDDEAPQ